MKKTLIALVLVLAMTVSAVTALAAYPEKPITLICGYSAGGSSDLLCRILANSLQEKLGTSVVVENLTGGGGWVCWNEIIKNTTPDGYTFCLVNTPNFNCGRYDATNPREYGIEDIDLLCNEVSDYNVIAVAANDDRFPDMNALVEYGKSNMLFYGASASGVMSDDGTIMERLNASFGTQFEQVPTGGAKDNETFLLNGTTDVLVGNVSDVLNGKNNGTFRVLCVFAPERVSLMDDVPTCAELGLGEIVGSSSRGYGLPKGVDPEVRAILYNALVEAVNDPATIQQLADMGAVTNFVPQEDYAAFLQNDTELAKAVYGIE